MIAIYKKEIKTYFVTFIGYVFLAFFAFTIGNNFLIYNVGMNNSSFTYTLFYSAIIFLVLIPTLTMRLFADEMKNKTDQLLYTSPINNLQIVLGKFFAAITIFLIGMLIISIFPIIIYSHKVLNVQETLALFLGFTLIVICFISIGVFISSITNTQISAAIATFAAIFFFYALDTIAANLPADHSSSILFLLIIALCLAALTYVNTNSYLISGILLIILTTIIFVVYASNISIYDQLIFKILSWFSIMKRFQNIVSGVFYLKDIIYLLTFPITFIVLTCYKMEQKKWN